MDQDVFEKGERVESNVAGLYMGMSGTVRGKLTNGEMRMYTVELDNGKIISLPYFGVKRLTE